MIDLKELRIGNKVKANGLHEGAIMTISEIRKSKDDTSDVLFFEESTVGEFPLECEGIELNEEWLIKLGGMEGFGSLLETYAFKVQQTLLIVDLFAKEIYTSHNILPATPLFKWNSFNIHFLQNIYFALAHNELTIKP